MKFDNRVSYDDLYNIALHNLDGSISDKDVKRLANIRRAWNFYEGFHWEELPDNDKPQVTENYCRPFVNKFVTFELGKEFNISYENKDLETLEVDNDGTTLISFLNNVWRENNKGKLCIELGQMKSITGDGWLQVKYFSPEQLDDPFGEFPKGKIRILVVPTNLVFPEYDEHDTDKIVKLTIMYPIQVQSKSPILRKSNFKEHMYKQVWTNDTVEVNDGINEPYIVENPYKTIPFVQIKNYPIAGRETGVGDLEDLIPLNIELNYKKSDISEIIDYHSAPITLVYGAKINSLEKGANKIWGGLPKDSRVENLHLKGDLNASVSYVDELKSSMHEIGGVPKGALGGTQAISNTSGVALQFINMPLIERTLIKRMCTKAGLERVNKLILLIATLEGVIDKPEGLTNYQFFNSEVTIVDTLPKDTLIELQEIAQEMALDLESRQNAMTRLGKRNINDLMSQIEEDTQRKVDLSTMMQEAQLQTQLNSGMMNGQTAIEQVRRENQGANAPTENTL